MNLLRIKEHWAFWILTAAYLIGCGWFWEFEIDDAYISMRYAQNLAGGWGLEHRTV